MGVGPADDGKLWIVFDIQGPCCEYGLCGAPICVIVGFAPIGYMPWLCG